MRQTFQPVERIRRRADYERVYAQGQKVQGRFMTIFVLRTTLGSGRLGIAATRKLGGAVQRNRAKRRIRELFRQLKPGPGVDLVVVPRPSALDQPFAALTADYAALLRRLRPGIQSQALHP